MVPWGMALVVGATGGMVAAGTGVCTAALVVESFVDNGVVEGVLVVVGDGVIGDAALLACDTAATSAGTETVAADGGTGSGAGLLRVDTGMLSAAGSGAEGRVPATMEDGASDGGSGLMGTAAVEAGTGESATGPVATGIGLNAVGVGEPSGEVTGGTTVSDGRSGSGATMARTSSGLRPSNSAF